METGTLLDIMKGRRTIREFRSDDINSDALDRIIQASTLPPSGADMLPYTFIIVRDKETKTMIRNEAEKVEKNYYENADTDLKKKFLSWGMTHEKPFLTEAPVLMVIAGDTTKPYWRESTWLSIGYILLAIESEGLGTVTYTPSDMDFVRDLMDLPDTFSPQVILPIGFPLNKPSTKSSKAQGRVFFEKYES